MKNSVKNNIKLRNYNLIKYKNKMVENYDLNGTLNREFMAKLGDIINDLFDPNTSFEQKPDENTCKYCKFIDICRR